MITPIIMVFSLSIEYSGVFELGVWLDYEIRFYAFKIVGNRVKYSNSGTYMCSCGIPESVSDFQRIVKENAKPDQKPVVWMLNPNLMNWACYGSSILPGTAEDEMIYNGQDFVPSIGFENVLSAFGGAKGHEDPIAVSGRFCHIRMRVQNSRFIVWGNNRKSLTGYLEGSDLIKQKLLYPFYINPEKVDDISDELFELGFSKSTLFPDLENFSDDIKNQYDQERPYQYT